MLTTFDEIETLAGKALIRKYNQPQISRINDEAIRVRGCLAAANITPLAVIQTDTWKRICEHAGLRIFSPDSLGQVLVNTDDATYFITAGRIASTSFWLAPWAGLGWLIVTNSTWSVPVMTSLACIYFALAMIRKDTTYDKKSAFISVHRGFTLALSHIYDMLPRRRIIERLLQIEGDPYYMPNTQRSALLMPEPPAEVVEILERAKKLYRPYKVALQPGGHSLGEKPSQLLRARLTGYVTKRAEKWSYTRANFDPILFVEIHGMTAILAQYGPFVIEREAVEQALAAEDSI
jgi:hypothetical protein